MEKLGRHAPRECGLTSGLVECESGHKLAVVPAHAGTHNHRLKFEALWRDGFLSDHEYHAVWVPACAGTTDEIAFRDV